MVLHLSMPRRNLSASQSSRRRSLNMMPLGVTDNYEFWGDKTIIVKDARGSRIRDVDDNTYDDFRLAYGPIILGYQDNRVDDHVRRALDDGVLFGLTSARAHSVAEMIKGHVPGLDMVRFANTGSDAVMTAMRLARAFTNREHFILFEGAFHGLFDPVMWRCDVDSWDPCGSMEPKVSAFGTGVPAALRDYVHFVSFNDADQVRDVMAANPDKIAAVLVEPILGNCGAIAPKPGYLRELRQVCDEFNALLIFDEVKTGFRIARGGAAETFGTRPDLWTFAKALGNGYPVAAFGGRSDIMGLVHPHDGGVMHGGTYTGNTVGLAAAEATLQVIGGSNALDEVANAGSSIQSGLSSIFARLGIPHCFTGHPAMFGVMFGEVEPRSYRDWRNTNFDFYNSWVDHLHDVGILVEPDSREPWFVCQAHNQLDLGDVLDRVETATVRTLQRQ